FEREGVAPAAQFYALVGSPAVDYRAADPATPRPKDFTSEFAWLKDKPDFIGLEGYLFPDTYRVYADATVEDIVRKMLENFDRKLTPELREEITKSNRSLHQIVTMASIVEAEIANHDDRPTAAGLLWKRRDRGMLLQVDASVNYVTGKHDPRVSREDTAADSSYNTYKYPGLPRGPIGNPGTSAILAALRPKESPYWFFLTTKDGKTVFSRTLEEHNINVQRHLR
ncbi:MAG: endolytic transglycosylase MltG, partial [bacterium]|nr:endolytic transglycosylase MltG [bacterium]